MKYLMLTFDLEELDFKSLGIKKNTKEGLDVSKQGFEKLIRVLKMNDVRATFFTTVRFANSCPDLIKKVLKSGFELALHAYYHEHNYSKMPPRDALKFISNGKKELEKKFKTNVVGFRAPGMFHPDYSILKKAGFEYDSSFHPIWLPGYYNNFFGPRKIFSKKGVKIVPVSVTPLIRLPFSWLWFRIFPLFYSKCCSLLNLINSDYLNIYFPPWEFVDIKKFKGKKFGYVMYGKTGEKVIKKLDNYIKWCKKKDLKDITIKEYLRL